ARGIPRRLPADRRLPDRGRRRAGVRRNDGSACADLRVLRLRPRRRPGGVPARMTPTLDLPELLARVEASGRPRRVIAEPVALLASDYRPWLAQKWLHRSQARFRVLVAGRGVGKTHAVAWELLQ